MPGTQVCDNAWYPPGESLEELAHGHEVELVGAVEHHTLVGHRLCQILVAECGVFRHVHTDYRR